MRSSYLKRWQSQLNLLSLADLPGIFPRVEKALRAFAQDRTGKTVMNYAEALSAFCDWCVRRGYLETDPLDGLAPFDTTPEVRRRAMTPDEVKRLLAVCPPERRLLYETALFSGLRMNGLATAVGRVWVQSPELIRAIKQDRHNQGGLSIYEPWISGFTHRPTCC